MGSEESIGKFIDAFQTSIGEGTFAKLTLANYKGSELGLQKVFARLIETKRGPMVTWQFRRETRDTFRNSTIHEAADELQALLQSGFRNAHLFTLTANYQLDIGKRSSRLNVGRPTIISPPPRSHDRKRTNPIAQSAYYLKALGITTDSGEVRAEQRSKWRQINKFIEILSRLVDQCDLTDNRPWRIVDFGSGKGYLTFAAYDFLNRTVNPKGAKTIEFLGVEARGDLCSLCNGIARAVEFDSLTFIPSTIEAFSGTESASELDIVVALHACDTATDDAILAGIIANARIIVTAPCCHREIRQQLGQENMLADVLKYPLLRYRMAEILTDAVRALVLEAFGYQVRMQEFVSTEHTPKNNLITAVRRTSWAKQPEKLERAHRLISLLGITRQKLLDQIRAKYCI